VRTRAWCATLVISGSLLAAEPCLAPAETPEEMLREGKGALEAKNFNRAEKIFAQLTKQDPSATNYAYLGVAEISGRGGAGHRTLQASASIGQ